MEVHEEISQGIIMESKEAFKEADVVAKVAAVDDNEHLNSGIVSSLPNDDMAMPDKIQVSLIGKQLSVYTCYLTTRGLMFLDIFVLFNRVIESIIKWY